MPNATFAFTNPSSCTSYQQHTGSSFLKALSFVMSSFQDNERNREECRELEQLPASKTADHKEDPPTKESMEEKTNSEEEVVRLEKMHDEMSRLSCEIEELQSGIDESKASIHDSNSKIHKLIAVRALRHPCARKERLPRVCTISLSS